LFSTGAHDARTAARSTGGIPATSATRALTYAPSSK
jgi:hypothetical protein